LTIVVRTLLGIDVLAALVIVYFFVVGVNDGSVSSFNGSLWAGLLAGTAAVVGGGWALEAKGHRAGAMVVLMILAIPAILYALFLALILITQPRWN
jgi:hypothetical protein